MLKLAAVGILTVLSAVLVGAPANATAVEAVPTFEIVSASSIGNVPGK